MTDPMQRAREMLAAEYEADGAPFDFVAEIRSGNVNRTSLGIPLRALAKALTREEEVRGEGWQSIETAPRDGTAVLIFEPGKGRESHMPIAALEPGECTYRASDPRLKWYDDKRYAIGYWRPWGDGSWGNRNSTTVQPTHWRPLPAPPAIRSANCGGGA